MYWHGYVFASGFLLFQSEAFVVPTLRANVLVNHQSLLFAQNDKSTTSLNEESVSRLDNQSYDIPSPSSRLRLQVETLLAPAATFLDDSSDGWALSYADLTPDSERTLPGQVFLATNIAYTGVGLILSLQGEILLGVFTDICSVASFCYHYVQLQQPYGRAQDSTVRLALLIDYMLAITSILIGLSYMIFDQVIPPPEGLACAIISIVCLLSCWVWEQGLPYIILHGLWHLFSAASAYYIGVAHATSQF
mmetsp:Transcript_6208/g.12831  ORF Transcript_6208/g.12831 Transcript_6208/m.12831 type:complete len:249 (-) Transcript_6208:40-786(-)